MAKNHNKLIRDALTMHDVRQWELADRLGLHPSSLSIKLRYELPPQEQEAMIQVIKEIEKENAQDE